MYRSMNLKGFLLILGIMLLVFLILHASLKGTVNEKAEQEKLLRVQKTKLEEKYKDLMNQMNVVGTDEYIMSSAVKDYSYVRKDSIRFEFTSGGTAKERACLPGLTRRETWTGTAWTRRSPQCGGWRRKLPAREQSKWRCSQRAQPGTQRTERNSWRRWNGRPDCRSGSSAVRKKRSSASWARPQPRIQNAAG